MDEGSNTWDNGYPSGGNYWSDYTGTDNDGDGIGDTPYNIPSGPNQDLYPLIYPFEMYTILKIILPDIPIHEHYSFPVVVYSLAELPIFNALVLFDNQTFTRDTKGTVWLTAPDVGPDTYYEITANKVGYIGADEKVLVKNSLHESGKALIFSRYRELTEDGG